MQNKNYLYIGIIAVLAVVIVFLIVGSNQQQQKVQMKPSTLIFKLKSDYSGNYLGAINYYSDTNTYRSFYTMELFDYCYMATIENWVCLLDENTGEEDCHCKGSPGVEDKRYCLASEEEICFNMDSDKQLKNGGVKKLSNNYYAVIYPASEEMVKRFAVFDKSIITKAISESDRVSIVPATFPKGIKPGMGDSMEMSREEFYSYVIDENPLIEAYFCDEPEQNLNAVARDLSNGEIPITCKQII